MFGARVAGAVRQERWRGVVCLPFLRVLCSRRGERCGRRELLGVVGCFVFEDRGEGGGGEPGRGEDRQAALTFEEDGKPEGKGRALGREERVGWALSG